MHRASLPSIPHSRHKIPPESPPIFDSYIANEKTPFPRRSLPDLASHSLDDKQLYPYVLRATLWYDRATKLSASTLLNSASMTSIARSVFGLHPNNKALDPAYSYVKLKCSDKHLYRDLNLYLKRIQLELVPARTPTDFPTKQAYTEWLVKERQSIESEIRTLVAKDSKVAKKSKFGGSSTNPNINAPLFIPPFADDGYISVLRKIIQMASSPSSGTHDTVSDDWLSPNMLSLLDLLQLRWRINPIIKHLIMLEQMSLIHLPSSHHANSDNNLHLIDSESSTPHQSFKILDETESILDKVLDLAHKSSTCWTIIQCSLTCQIATNLASTVSYRLQNYSQFYPNTHFVSVITALSRLIFKSEEILKLIPTTKFTLATPKPPSLIPLLRNAALSRWRQHVKTITAEYLFSTSSHTTRQILNTYDPNATQYSVTANERIFDLCTLVMTDLSKLEDAFGSSTLASDEPLPDQMGSFSVLLILEHQLLSDLFGYIDEHEAKPVKTLPINDVFHYYNLVSQLAEKFRKVYAKLLEWNNSVSTRVDPVSLHLQRLAEWFQDSVDDWIERTSETMTSQWTHRIIAQDQFVAQLHSSDMQSTSVIDLYSALHQEVDVIRSLAWPSFHYEYRASKKFARTMCFTLTQYANHIQSQIIAILLQMEDAADNVGEPNKLGDSSESIMSTSISLSSQSLSDRSKSLIHRLRSALVQHIDKDQAISSRVTRMIRIPVSFNEPLCVRMNNLYAAKRRIDGLYTHLISALSCELPDEGYVSPSPRDESLIEMTSVVVELEPAILNVDAPEMHASDVFWVEVGLQGTPLGRTPSIRGIVRQKSDASTQSLTDINIDSEGGVQVPGASAVTVELTVYASTLDGELAATSIQGFGSIMPTNEEKMAKTKGGLLVGVCAATVDVCEVTNPEGLSKSYSVETSNASQWAIQHGLDKRRLSINVVWKRKECMYMYHHFDRVYSQLSDMIDNGLLMMANQIGKWIQDYMLQLVKQYKISVIAKAFGGSGTDMSKDNKAEASPSLDSNESSSVSFKTRGGRKEISYTTIEADMEPLLEYLNSTLQVLNSHMHEKLTTKLFKRVWRDVIIAIEWQLTGRRERPSGKWKQLDQAQVALLQCALKLLFDFFHVDGDGLPLDQLKSRPYHRLMSILTYYHSETDDLMHMYQSCINFYLTSEVDALSKRLQSKLSLHNESTRKSNLDLDHGQASSKDIKEVMTYLTLSRLPSEPDVSRAHSIKKSLKAHIHRRFQTMNRSRPGTGLSASDFFSNADSFSLEGPMQNRAPLWLDSDSDEIGLNGNISSLSSNIHTRTESSSNPGSLSISEPQRDQHVMPAPEFGIESLARQEALWTILCLHADTDNHECHDFVTDQAATMRRVLDNLRVQNVTGLGQA